VDTVDIAQDLMGRKQAVTDPYRTTSDPTYGVTITQYDGLGRVVQVAPPDGTPPTPSGCDPNNVCTSYSGNSTTVTDQAGNWRTSVTDGLGRLSQVVEPNPAGGTAVTLYQYNALDDLTCVAQTGVGSPNFTCAAAPASARPRSFAYNSLSQLTSATNPESGTITYTYDLNGNVLSKTAPQPNATTGTPTVTTNYTYDALDRVLQKSYTGMTASTVSFGYDGIALAPTACATAPPALTDPNPKPLRTSMCDGSGASSWSHDVMGRTAAENRTTAGVNQQVQYNYNLDGSVQSITYPSGRLVSYLYSAAGRALSVSDATTNYVTGASYTPPGELKASALGSNILTANSYNNRLQPVTLAAANITSSQLVFSLNYDFHLGGSDNGNVYQIVNNRSSNRGHHFSYDSLNRITQAWSTGDRTTLGTPGSDWGEAYTLDIFGNLTNIGAITNQNGNCRDNYETLNAAPALNNNQLSTFVYDTAGNLIGNPVQYVYDPENRISSTWGGSSYLYDGDGQRVKKTSGSTGTLYWTGSGGQVLAESDLAGTPASMVDYIFFNGQRIARQDSSLHYYFSDHLGSTSIVTDASGTIQNESDYYPYGGEIPVTPGDANHYKFTGQERDAETGNDYFEARHYSSGIGRFMSPDDGTGQSLANPQSLNRYSYVFGNPLSFVDPTGHSTQTALNGDVLVAYNDGDNGVYQHTDIDNRADWDGSDPNSDDEGTNYMGETRYWDEFAKLDGNTNGIDHSSSNATIHFGDARLDRIIAFLNAIANMQSLLQTALDSRNGSMLDIKSDRSLTNGNAQEGYLMGGYYTSVRSAGNYLAGMDVMTGKDGGKYVSAEFAQKLFGAYQAAGGGEKGFAGLIYTYTTGKAYPGTSAPYWGEQNYSGRMQQLGMAAGRP
jgi:RHS repeat-associated protein